ncbi:MAG: right-handed parallel beta-helix repeat-containing protein [Armatimonadota bacterium]|nr:right-handed parallel beta-helix repeat-containing protein [Armatimonadota bacterium]
MIISVLCCALAFVFSQIAFGAEAMLPNSDQALLILNSKNFADTEMALQSLREAGCKPAHVFPPRVVIANVPQSVESLVRGIPGVSALYRGASPVFSAADGSDLAIGSGAWNNILASSQSGLDAFDPQGLSGAPLVNDARMPPPIPLAMSAPSPAVSHAPGYYETSEFMAGKVAVGIILPESTSGSENWDSSRQTNVINKIVAGMDWYLTKGNPAANLTFYYDQHLSVPTSYEPITMQGWMDEYLWVTDIFQNMGYTSGSNFDCVMAYNNSIRTSLQTDWCFTFIVVDSLLDTDGSFTSGYFAYAYLNGPYVIMTYDNDGYGIGGMDYVASHETGHIFAAADEYCQPGYACCNFSYYGYLSIYNGNCEYGNPSSVPCYMKSNAGSNNICTYSKNQLGWRDTDLDSIYDPMDNVVSNTLNTPAINGFTATVTGMCYDIPYDSPYRADVTINKISTVKYRVNGGSWLNATSADGLFNEDVEDFYFTLTVEDNSSYYVESQAFSTSGNASPIVGVDIEVNLRNVFVSKTATGPAHDGRTWNTAFLTVQEGINAPIGNGEVWVAAGNYVERVTLKSRTALYGGFAGNETLREQRDWKTNVTALDGNQGGSVVTANSTVTQNAIIDGFTIRNGRYANGAGISCISATLTISNDIITGNSAIFSGGGIYCSQGSQVFINNIIRNNTAGNGGGISLSSSSPTLTNNTIISNSATSSGGGIKLSLSSPQIKNTIFSGNTGAQGGCAYKDTLSNPVFSNCCFWNNGSQPFYPTSWNPAGSGSNLIADPKFAAPSLQDYHLRLTSPCVDAGTNDGIWPADFDGFQRSQDGNGDLIVTSDIGAYERALSIGAVRKSYPNSNAVLLGGVAVTASFPSLGCVYVQNLEQAAGIRVDTPLAFSEGQLLNVSGEANTDPLSGERYIIASPSSPQVVRSSPPLKPFGLSNRDAGGKSIGLQAGVMDASGINNFGLFIRVWGTVTYQGLDYFYIDDGSELNDGSGHLGMKVAAEGLTIPNVEKYVVVSGISSCYKADNKIYRLIRPRHQEDITVFD